MSMSEVGSKRPVLLLPKRCIVDTCCPRAQWTRRLTRAIAACLISCAAALGSASSLRRTSCRCSSVGNGRTCGAGGISGGGAIGGAMGGGASGGAGGATTSIF